MQRLLIALERLISHCTPIPSFVIQSTLYGIDPFLEDFREIVFNYIDVIAQNCTDTILIPIIQKFPQKILNKCLKIEAVIVFTLSENLVSIPTTSELNFGIVLIPPTISDTPIYLTPPPQLLRLIDLKSLIDSTMLLSYSTVAKIIGSSPSLIKAFLNAIPSNTSFEFYVICLYIFMESISIEIYDDSIVVREKRDSLLFSDSFYDKFFNSFVFDPHLNFYDDDIPNFRHLNTLRQQIFSLATIISPFRLIPVLDSFILYRLSVILHRMHFPVFTAERQTFQ